MCACVNANRMSSWNFWVKDLAERLSEATGTEVQINEIVRPPDVSMGEFAFACFRLAKERKQNPAELAKELADKITKDHSDLAEIQALGPYVNFRLATSEAVARVVKDVETQGEAYGSSNNGEQKSVLFEYAQMNSHKEVHVGHLRNLAMGLSLVRILRMAGWLVTPVSYHGDIGTHVAKCLWWFVTSRRATVHNFTIDEANRLIDACTDKERSGGYMGEVYAESSKQLAERPEAKEDVSQVLQWLEAHEPAWELLWQETRRWSLDDLGRDFTDLGVMLARQYLESEVVNRGQEMVDFLLVEKIAKESQGAIVVDLEDQKKGIFLVRKSDGTSLYATKDLALAELKLKEYPSTDRSIIMVDNRQSFYFKQLFATLELLKIHPVPEFIGYEFVTLKSGAMSSRDGNVVTYHSLHDAVIAYACKEVMARHPDWGEGRVTHTAWALAMGGMKFGMLRQDGDKVFTFELEEALAFEGATGPYCQYAATRMGSILRKAGATDQELTGTLKPIYAHASEKALALMMANFPKVVEVAAAELRPAVIAQWCHEMAQRMNDFYRDVPVLEAKGDERIARLRLITTSRQVLAKGLELLGIPLPDEM